jgi:osomolarity two-component system response regulator SKN7
MSDRKDSSGGHEDSMSSTSDFVKKLYKCGVRLFHVDFSHRVVCRMLEDQTFQNVVSWGPQGDCFVVKVHMLAEIYDWTRLTCNRI